MPGLGVARSHRPERLLFLKRSLDLGPVGPWIDTQPGIVIGNHQRATALLGCRTAILNQAPDRGHYTPLNCTSRDEKAPIFDAARQSQVEEHHEMWTSRLYSQH